MCSLHSSCPPVVTTRVRCDKQIQAAHNLDGDVSPVPAAFNSRNLPSICAAGFPITAITGFLGSLRVSVTPCLRGRCSDFASGVLLRPPQKQRTYAPSPRSEPGMVLRSQVPNTKYQLPSFKLSMTLGTSARHSQ